MKFALKTLVIAAAVAAAGAANAAAVTGAIGQAVVVNDPGGSGRQAELKLLSGGGALAFSAGSGFDGTDPNTLGGLIGALNVGKVAITGVGGATVQESTLPDEFGDEVRTSSTATAAVVALTADDQTGQVLSVNSTGGALQVGTRIGGTLTGGSGSVTNLRFDLANKVVYADLAGTKAAVGTNPAVNYNLPNTALWTIDNISGPTTIPPEALLAADPVAALQASGFSYLGKIDGVDAFSATNVISGLRVTTAGFEFFKNSLGLLSTGVNALDAVNDDPLGWGTVTSTLTFTAREVTPTVPEASTYAMMGVGLLVVGGALRARRRAQK
ncbi:MAG: hypothetical protein EOP38_13775 [Rubrivivax sp.]|nr:MAG: hypothetical protein EOP38_13775 [Rubrivivax sp.]